MVDIKSKHIPLKIVQNNVFVPPEGLRKPLGHGSRHSGVAPPWRSVPRRRPPPPPPPPQDCQLPLQVNIRNLYFNCSPVLCTFLFAQEGDIKTPRRENTNSTCCALDLSQRLKGSLENPLTLERAQRRGDLRLKQTEF